MVVFVPVLAGLGGALLADLVEQPAADPWVRRVRKRYRAARTGLYVPGLRVVAVRPEGRFAPEVAVPAGRAIRRMTKWPVGLRRFLARLVEGGAGVPALATDESIDWLRSSLDDAGLADAEIASGTEWLGFRTGAWLVRFEAWSAECLERGFGPWGKETWPRMAEWGPLEDEPDFLGACIYEAQLRQAALRQGDVDGPPTCAIAWEADLWLGSVRERGSPGPLTAIQVWEVG